MAREPRSSSLAVSPLVDAITRNSPVDVATILDQPAVLIDQEALVALVHLAWKTRGSDEDPEQVEPAEQARKIFDLLAAGGADFHQDSPRGRIIDRIAKVQPDWPQAIDRAMEPNRREFQAARDPEAPEDFATSRVSRGAMHRTRRP